MILSWPFILTGIVLLIVSAPFMVGAERPLDPVEKLGIFGAVGGVLSLLTGIWWGSIFEAWWQSG